MRSAPFSTILRLNQAVIASAQALAIRIANGGDMSICTRAEMVQMRSANSGPVHPMLDHLLPDRHSGSSLKMMRRRKKGHSSLCERISLWTIKAC
jgi:hypothetical protein